MNYLLGDNDIAARRLKLVAEIFAPSTEAFLIDARLSRPELTLDLGCGPGHTTKLLANTLKGSATVGIDSSEIFITEAVGSRQMKGVSFVCHDISKMPLPICPADIIFGRYILLHLEKPHEVVEKWLTQLNAGGLLILEELDQIQTSERLFQKYLNLLERSLAVQDKTMFIGATMASSEFDAARIKMNRVRKVEVSARNAAEMFSMNMHTLQKSATVRALYCDQEIGRFIADLTHVADEEETTMEPVDWKLRQIVLQKT